MKKLSLSLSGMLLATTAMIAPGLAHAQSDPSSASAPAMTTADPEMQADPVDTVQDIVVRGRYIPELNRESAEVAAFLTVADVVRTGDSSAAEALTRVTGLTVVEGRFVYVRGLGERYSSALLNGSPLPSPEPLQRVVPLDLFPSNILGGVTVQKSYSPRYPGEFGGGVIDLQTISVPTKPFFAMEASVGGNSVTTGRQGLLYYGSRTDFTGFDDGTRDIPAPLKAALAAGKPIIAGTNFTDKEVQDIGQSLVNAPLRLLQRDNTPVNFGLELSGGGYKDTDWGVVGLVGVLGYDNSWATRKGFQELGQLDAGDLVAVNSYVFNSNQNDITLNALGSLSLTTDTSEIKWTNFFVRKVTKEARTRQGPNFAAGGNNIREDYTEWFERQLISTQLAGEHEFADGALKFSWRGSAARSTRDAPYETMFGYGEDASGKFIHARDRNLISFSELTDDLISGGADIAYTMMLGGTREAVFSAGVASFENSRDSTRRDLTFRAPNGLTQSQLESRVDFLFSDFNINPNTLVIQEIVNPTSPATYEAELQVNAVYAQVDAEVVPLVRVSAGARFEDGEQRVVPVDIFNTGLVFNPTMIDEQYVLPSATVTWNFYDDMQLRLAASKTIGRPQFRELAPQQYTDPESDRSFIGNPYLVDTEIMNVDARYEWYFDRQQYLTFGAFYKDLTNPVESTVIELARLEYQQTFLNSPKAEIMGLEVEGKKYFEFADSSHPFIRDKRWLIQANYTWSDSKVKVGPNDTVRTTFGLGLEDPASFYIADGSRLQGQSEHVANAQFGWEDDTARSQATIIVNYVSERTTARGTGVGAARLPDYIQDPGVFVDFVYRKDFTGLGDRDYSFSFKLRNIFGTEFDEYQELGNRIRINNYDIGRSLSFGLSSKF